MLRAYKVFLATAYRPASQATTLSQCCFLPRMEYTIHLLHSAYAIGFLAVMAVFYVDKRYHPERGMDKSDRLRIYAFSFLVLPYGFGAVLCLPLAILYGFSKLFLEGLIEPLLTWLDTLV